jgi:hypothetical protein
MPPKIVAIEPNSMIPGRFGVNFDLAQSRCDAGVLPRRNNSGNFEMFVAIRRASARVEEVRRRTPAGLVLQIEQKDERLAL